MANARGQYGQTGGGEAGGGEIFVHADLDGPGRIQHRNPGIVKPVEHVHAKDHLLQRAGRHGADQNAVEVSQRIGRTSDPSMDTAKVDRDGVMVQQCGCALQVANMPTSAGRQNGDVHRFPSPFFGPILSRWRKRNA